LTVSLHLRSQRQGVDILELFPVEQHPGYGQPLRHGPFLAVLADEHFITAPDDVAPSRISVQPLRRSIYEVGPVLIECPDFHAQPS